MDWLQILEQYGIPVVVAIAFGFFIWKQNKYIQDDLSADLKDKHERLESILIKLIDNSKKQEIRVEKLAGEIKSQSRYSKTIVEIMAKLSGNGLKDNFLRMQNAK